MTEKSEDVEKIYNAALEKPSEEERSSYLDAVCGDDHTLRARVEALLKANDRAGSFLEIPDVERAVTLNGPVAIEGPGTRIGRYELLELIGEGGMGWSIWPNRRSPSNAGSL